MDGVDKQDYWKVVDQCYLCDTCYMTKCPYVPPHPWNVDFPHLMLRAKAIKFRKGEITLPRPAAHLHRCDGQAEHHSGRGADGERAEQECALPQAFWTARSACTRTASCPSTRAANSVRTLLFRKAFEVKDGKNTPGKVAIFSTCYVNYNEPGMGHDLLAVLAHNEIPYVLLRAGSLLRHAEARTGRPRLRLLN